MNHKYYAVIKENKVEGVIVADDDFIPLIAWKYDAIVEVPESGRPSPGNLYDPEAGTFSKN